MPKEVIEWWWEEAFDKFGFGDGDGMVMTYDVVCALQQKGYEVDYNEWGLHNTVIDSIKKDGKEIMTEEMLDEKNITLGYDNPRDFLPKEIIDILDAEFPSEGPYPGM